VNRLRRFYRWSRRTRNRFTLIWGVCLWGILCSISMLTLAARDGTQFSVPAIAIIFLVFLACGYLWGTVMWWGLLLTERVMRALRNRQQRRRSN
jgi:hypothetical protein